MSVDLLPPRRFLSQLGLNLGSGLDLKYGFINLDISKDYLPDVISDLEQPLPFKSESFYFVYASHILEHIKNYYQLIQEIWRVLKMDGIFVAVVPHAYSRAAIADPSHVRLFVPESFFHLSDTFLGPISAPSIWGLFQIIDIHEIPHDYEVDGLVRGSYFTEIYCEMKKIPKATPPKIVSSKEATE